MSEIRIDENGIYFDHKIGITAEKVADALAHPDDLPGLYQQVQEADSDLDLSLEEFVFFLRQVNR